MKERSKKLANAVIRYCVPSIAFVEAIAYQEEDTQLLLEYYLGWSVCLRWIWNDILLGNDSISIDHFRYKC